MQTLASVDGAHVMLGVNILLWVWGECYQARKVGVGDVRGDRGTSHSIFCIRLPLDDVNSSQSFGYLFNSKETFFKSDLGF